MNESTKGQSFVETALVLPILLIVFMGMIAFGMVIHDMSLANNSAQAATHAAAIHIADGSGATCYSRAMEALGNPTWIMVEEANFTLEPCSSTDPNWVGPMGTKVMGIWNLVVNPPIAFLYSNGPFPLSVSIPFKDTFR